MNAISLLVEALDLRWKNYRNNLELCRQDFSEAAVHDVRVSTRRLLALVDLLRALAPHPRLQKLRRSLKDQLDGYDDLRDTQVMLVEVSETLDEVPELKPYEAYLLKRERKMLRVAAKQVKTFKLAGITRWMKATRQALLMPTDERIFNQSILQSVDDAYATVLQRFNRVDASQPPSIHHLRVAFKKFRYMVEIARPTVPGLPDNNFQHMHAYQAAMGDVQDMEVQLMSLADFARRDSSYDPEPARRYFQRRHREAIHAFIEDMQQVHMFWRVAPDAQFPWADSSDGKGATRSGKPGDASKSDRSNAPAPPEPALDTTDQENRETQ